MSCDEALEVAIYALSQYIETPQIVGTRVVNDRQLNNALSTLRMIKEQEGCEHFDPAVEADGKLTSLMDVIIFG